MNPTCLFLRPARIGLLAILLVAAPALAQTAVDASHAATSPNGVSPNAAALCASCVRRNLEYLAGPELHGRGSGTEDEHHAAEFIAATLKDYGLAPAAENGQYIQTATIHSCEVTGQPGLSFDTKSATAKTTTWKSGNEFAIYSLSQPDAAGPLQKLDLSDTAANPSVVKPGSVLLLKLKPGTPWNGVRSIVGAYATTNAALVIVPDPPSFADMFVHLAERRSTVRRIGDREPMASPSVIVAKTAAFEELWAQPESTSVKLHAEAGPWQTSHTWNVLAKLDGTTHPEQIILLSAHLDHLGVRNGETYYGADDDASGTVGVMELARAFAQQPRPKRTIMFALWGSEEAGLLGSQYFLRYPTFPLKNIAAYLELEMIARADPKIAADELWLTGWDRTNLGPELAAHGAKLVGDPHPEEQFFTRSDNYAFARRGVVAQTVSSYGLHKDYHQPTDTLDEVNWQHLDSAVGSLIAPITWLANSDFQPQWAEGKKP